MLCLTFVRAKGMLREIVQSFRIIEGTLNYKYFCTISGKDFDITGND
jgi:hypothetical protein